ncbi:hypothetical protein BDV11DRAFT_181731 [Aspergillus similis]
MVERQLAGLRLRLFRVIVVGSMPSLGVYQYLMSQRRLESKDASPRTVHHTKRVPFSIQSKGCMAPWCFFRLRTGSFR